MDLVQFTVTEKSLEGEVSWVYWQPQNFYQQIVVERECFPVNR